MGILSVSILLQSCILYLFCTFCEKILLPYRILRQMTTGAILSNPHILLNRFHLLLNFRKIQMNIYIQCHRHIGMPHDILQYFRLKWLFHDNSSMHTPEWSQRYSRIDPTVHRTNPPLLLLSCPYSNGDFVSMMRFSAGVSPCHWYRSTIWVSSCLAKCNWISKAYRWLSEREIFRWNWWFIHSFFDNRHILLYYLLCQCFISIFQKIIMCLPDFHVYRKTVLVINAVHSSVIQESFLALYQGNKLLNLAFFQVIVIKRVFFAPYCKLVLRYWNLAEEESQGLYTSGLKSAPGKFRVRCYFLHRQFCKVSFQIEPLSSQ